MPRFLISDSFNKLEDRTRERRGSSTKVVDMNAILNEPEGACLSLSQIRCHGLEGVRRVEIEDAFSSHF